MKKLILSLIVLLSILLTSCSKENTYQFDIVVYYSTTTDTIKNCVIYNSRVPYTYSSRGTNIVGTGFDVYFSSTAPVKIINLKQVK